MPPRFGWYGNDGFWLPLSPTRTDLPWINPIVRLAPGVSKAVAEEQLSALIKRLAQEKPATFPAQGFTDQAAELSGRDGRERRDADEPAAAPGRGRRSCSSSPAPTSPTCSWRAAPRARARWPSGCRLAPAAAGCSRQLLTESVLLSLAGGALGVLFAFLAHSLNRRADARVLRAERVARRRSTSRCSLFSLGVSLLTGIVFGLVPALQTSKPDITDALRAGRSTGAGTHGGRTRNLLVVIEVALSVVLLVSAGLTVRTFFVLQNMDAGINADRVLLVGVPLPPAKYTTLEQRNRFARGTAGPGGRAPRRRGGHVRPSVRQPAITVHDRGTHT